jgi:hypothetical protein
MCSDSLRAALLMAISSPKLFIKYGPKLIYLIFIKGLHFSAGPKACIIDRRAKIICLGNCAKKYAEEQGFSWASGCPPSPKEILNAL